MQTPPQIDFHGCEASGRFRELIETRLDDLETRFGRITAARVVMKGPGGHHKTGGQYEIGVHLTLPGGHKVDVDRTPDKDERFGKPDFAINDAFNRARRQLQDVARRMAGKVKHHEAPPAGKVVRLDPDGEYGFIEANDGREFYFHRNSVLGGGFGKLEIGSPVTFVEEMGREGPQASTVKLEEKHQLRA